MLACLVVLVIVTTVFADVLVKEVLFFLLDVAQLDTEVLDCLFQALLILLKLLHCLLSFVIQFLRTFDQHIDILHHVIL